MPLYDHALRYFLAVHEAGSVNGAARRLLVAGSAVSRQIGRLEREVGTPLFERRPGGVAPTEAGNALAGFARRAIQDAEGVVEEIQERHGASPLISVATSTGIGREFLPRVAADYRNMRNGARFEIHETEPVTATHMVRDGLADVAVTFNIAIESGVRIVHSAPSPLHAVVRAGHPLAGRAGVGLAEVLRFPLVLSSPRTTNRRLVDVVTASNGAPLEPVLVHDSPEAALRFIRCGDSVGLFGMISVAQDVADGAVAAVPLREKELGQRTLQVQTRTGRRLPAPVQDFVDYLVAALADTRV